MTTPSQLRQTPDAIRHLMQVAHKWAAETNHPDHGRSDTLEIELRKVLQPVPAFKVDEAERDSIKEIIAGLAFICEISDTGKLVDHAFNELERRRSGGVAGDGYPTSADGLTRTKIAPDAASPTVPSKSVTLRMGADGKLTGDDLRACPRCKQPAVNLFRLQLPGDELDTTHCGCLYARGVARLDPLPEGPSPLAISEALHEAAAAIYFADSSDYLPALWSVVRNLAPGIAELLEKHPSAAYHTTDAERDRLRNRGVPEAQPQQEKNMELPDAIRVPLDELEADAAYIIGRVAADGSCSGIMVEAIRRRTRAVREALLAHGVLGTQGDKA